MKKFLRKSRNCKPQKQHRKMISQQKFPDIFMKTNFCVENLSFPFDLKLADVTPTFKKKPDK